MKKRLLRALVVLFFLGVILWVGLSQQKEEQKINNNDKVQEICIEENNNTITIDTTIMNAIDASIDLSTVRIEQMFVVDTYIDSITKDYVIVLEDTKGMLWEYSNIDVYMEEEVLVLLSDNGTQEVEDDLIIHFWIGIE
jgi:hypothetical protein